MKQIQDEIQSLLHYDDGQAVALCQELRTSMLQTIAQTGGHLASNLGAVETTVALHRVFDFKRDRLIFDVGHQCYSHKMLTGRREQMETLRTFGGLSGFPKPSESVTDAFVAGHASNSVSVAVGMARARTMLQDDYHVIAFLGDGALSGGLAYEGLSDGGQSGEPLLVILNDNGMSITPSVGGVSQYLAQQRLKPQYLRFKEQYRKFLNIMPFGEGLRRVGHGIKSVIKGTLLPSSFFEDMGFTYLGPVDGHDVGKLTRLLRYAKEVKGPVLLHIRTTKGKGYPPAEEHPEKYHGVGAFSLETGEPYSSGGENFSSCFGKTLCQLAQKDTRICGVTAAMGSGTGLDSFATAFPDRFFDVGIAEGHATAMVAGMAKQGALPVFAVYSTFLQRAYDMLFHDVAIQNLHVVFGVDRAGLVGEDGETHHGLFDPAFLRTIPNMNVLCPSNYGELEAMLSYALYQMNGPVAIRYPRGGQGEYQGTSTPLGSTVIAKGYDITLVTYGTTINQLNQCAALLEQEGVSCQVIKLNAIAPLDVTCVAQSVAQTGRLLVAEEAYGSPVGQEIVALLAQQGVAPVGVALCGITGGLVPQGTVSQLREFCHIDGQSLYQRGKEVLAIGKETTGYTPL